MSIITTKKQLRFYIEADRVMNGYPSYFSFKRWLEDLVLSNPPIIAYLKNMRKLSYYSNGKSLFTKVYCFFLYRQRNRLSRRCSGLYIAKDVCGYGVVVPHPGTIRVGQNNSVGKYCVIHTMVNMTQSNVVAGDGLYLSVGCKLIGPIKLGNNVSVAANSVVRKSCDSNCLLAGVPAMVKKDDYPAWYVRDGKRFSERIEKCEALRIKYGLSEDC